jgi:uncharacterized membrane protein YhaH (DUF805 family)
VDAVNGEGNPQMGPIRAIANCYLKIVTFSGRARRAEYWWFAVFMFLCAMGVQLAILLPVLTDPQLLAMLADPVGAELWFREQAALLEAWWLPMGLAWFLLGFLPQLSVTVRRLHDTNRSGWYIFMPAMVTFVSYSTAFAVAIVAGDNATMNMLMFLALIAPVLAMIWYLIVLCLPGTNGPNRFGPDPVEGRKAREPDHPAFAARMGATAQQADIAAMRRAEIKDYYRTRVLPGIQKV